MIKAGRPLVLLAAAALGACSPTLDWREFVPEGSEISATFPCRVDRHARPVVVAQASVRMEMLVCNAGDATWAVSFFDVADPSRVAATLADWRETAVRNVQGAVAQQQPWEIRGMTPNSEAQRLVVVGRLPDGAAVREHAVFFVRGLRVYSATVLGANPPPQAVDTFFNGLKFPP